MIDPAELRELVAYNPETGEFTWLWRPRSRFGTNRAWNSWNAKNAGNAAFNTSAGQGYLHGSVHGRKMKAHRVAWAISHGAWPRIIDHLNGNPADNRICNLRSVDQCLNMLNQRLKSNNTSGVTGVSFDRRRGTWRAEIAWRGRREQLGAFRTKDAAVAARRDAEKRYPVGPNHGALPSQAAA